MIIFVLMFLILTQCSLLHDQVQSPQITQHSNSSYVYLPMASSAGHNLVYILSHYYLLVNMFEECSLGKRPILTIKIYFPRNSSTEKIIILTITQDGFVLRNISGRGFIQHFFGNGNFQNQKFRIQINQHNQFSLKLKNQDTFNKSLLLYGLSQNISIFQIRNILLFLSCSMLLVTPILLRIGMCRNNKLYVFNYQISDYFFIPIYLAFVILGCEDLTQGLMFSLISFASIIAIKYYGNKIRTIKLQMLIPIVIVYMNLYAISFEVIAFGIGLAHLHNIIKVIKQSDIDSRLNEGYYAGWSYYHTFYMYFIVIALACFEQPPLTPTFSLPLLFYLFSLVLDIIVKTVNYHGGFVIFVKKIKYKVAQRYNLRKNIPKICYVCYSSDYSNDLQIKSICQHTFHSKCYYSQKKWKNKCPNDHFILNQI